MMRSKPRVMERASGEGIVKNGIVRGVFHSVDIFFFFIFMYYLFLLW